MRHLATYCLSIFFLLGTIFSTNAYAHTEDSEPYLTKRFTVSSPSQVKVKTSGGNIRVAGHKGNDVEVKMYVKKNGAKSWFGSDSGIEEDLEDYTINIKQEGNTIYAEAIRKGKGWGNNSLSIAFELKVPIQMSAELNTSGGSITMSNLEGEHDVKTSGGSLNFDNITGFTEAHTSGGSITVEAYSGVLNARTSGGSIRTINASGEIKLNTSGGSIVLEDVSGSVDASTSGGSIKAFIKGLDNYLTLKTSGGSINAVIPEGLGVDLDLAGSRVNTRLSNFTGAAEKNSIEGKMNGGGIPITMKTSGGSVNLEYHRIQASN